MSDTWREWAVLTVSSGRFDLIYRRKGVDGFNHPFPWQVVGSFGKFSDADDVARTLNGAGA